MVNRDIDSNSTDLNEELSWDYEIPKRESALLTPKQREYLIGESDIEPKSAEERAIRNRMRERLHVSLLDLELLSVSLEERDIKSVFEKGEIFNHISPTFGLIFDGLARASKYNHPSSDFERPNDEVLDMYANFVEGGLESLYRSRGFSVEDVSVSIDLTLGPTADEIEKKQLNTLSTDELTLLLQRGEITREEFTDTIESDNWSPNS